MVSAEPIGVRRPTEAEVVAACAAWERHLVLRRRANWNPHHGRPPRLKHSPAMLERLYGTADESIVAARHGEDALYE